MNIKELTDLTLHNMNEDTDEKTRQLLRDEIVLYLNLAYLDLMVQRIKVRKEEKLDVSFGPAELQFCPVKILSVEDEDGKGIAYLQEGKRISAEGRLISVVYTYLPPELKEDEDQPDFDPSLHYILADYATYRMFLKGSRQRQQRGEAFYSSYLMGTSKLISELPTVTLHKFGEHYG